MWLDLAELGAEGWAEVLAIRAADVAPGVGRLVTGTFERLSDDVYEVRFSGEAAVLRGTGSHPLYSLDRDAWVQVRDLRLGERLQTAESAVRVEALEKVRGVHRVYNLEVEGDHEYLVGDAWVRAHNSCVEPGDLGLSGRGVKELTGEVFDAGTTRIMDIKMLQAEGMNLVELRNAVPNMLERARRDGVKTLQINAQFANEVLERAVRRQVEKHGGSVSTSAGTDVITFILE